MDEMYYDFEQFLQQMKQTTENLKQMNEAIGYMRWQFGDTKEYENFVKAMHDATDGWMSSHC